MGWLTSLMIFIDLAAEKSFDSRFHFLFIGAGAEKAGLMAKAKENNLKNVTFWIRWIKMIFLNIFQP